MKSVPYFEDTSRFLTHLNSLTTVPFLLPRTPWKHFSIPLGKSTEEAVKFRNNYLIVNPEKFQEIVIDNRNYTQLL